MSPREPIVWIVQESWSNSSDLSSANRYGVIRPILAARDRPSTAPGPCKVKIRNALKDYQPGDYLCYTLADPMSLMLLTTVLIEEGWHRHPIKWLRWERERDIDGQRKTGGGFYVESIIHLTDQAAFA